MTQRTSRPPPVGNGRRGFSLAASRSRFNQGLPSAFRSSLKTVKPQQWQRLFENPQQSMNHRAKPLQSPRIQTSARDDFSAVIDESSFLNEKSQRSFLSPAVQEHIEHLYEQIEELTLQLSDERFRHKQTQVKVNDVLASRSRDQNEQFEALLLDKLRDHQQQFQEQEKKHQKLLVEEQERILQREEQWKNELNFVKHSFHFYKINLDRTEKPAVQPDETLHPKSQQEVTNERRRMSVRDRVEIEKQHSTDFDVNEKNREEISSDQTDLRSVQKELRRAKVELKKRKAQVTDLTERLKQLDIQYQNATRQLNENPSFHPLNDI